MKILNFKHLEENECAYCSHFKRSIYIGMIMAAGSFVSIVHAFFPFLFYDAASKLTNRLLKIDNFPSGEIR